MAHPRVELGRTGIWYGMIDSLRAPQAKAAARLAEDLGYGTLWVAEAVGRDPFVSSALLLDSTERLALATGIANIYARDPMTMVAGQRALAEAFPDRFLLGLGVSHGHLVAGIRKHDWSRPYSHMVDYLERMDNALYMAVTPEHDPGRVLAALGPRMLRLSANRANGALTYFVPPEHTAIARDTMGSDALLAVEQMVVLSTDPDEARRIAREGMAIYLRLPNYFDNLVRLGFSEADRDGGGSDRLVDAVVAWGTPDQIAERVSQHHAAGADHVCVQVLRDDLSTAPEPEWRSLAGVLLG